MKNKKLSVILRMLPLVMSHRWPFIFSISALFIGSGINLIFPEVIRRILNQNNFSVFQEHSILIALILISLFALQAICFYIRIYFFGIIGHIVVTNIRKKLFKILLTLPIESFDKTTPADSVSRLMNDTSLLQEAVTIKLSVLIRYTAQVVLGVAAMFWISFSLSFSVIIALLLLSGMSVVLSKKLKKLSRILQEKIAAASSIAAESFSGIKMIRSFMGESFIKDKFNFEANQSQSVGIERTKISAFFQSFVNFLMNSFLVIILVFGLYLSSTGYLSIGDLTSFLLYGVIVAVSFAFSISSFAELSNSIGGAERVFEILDLENKFSGDNAKDKTSITSLPSSIGFTFNDVTFSYPTRPHNPALVDCSFEIPAGKSTALVGVSGAGKSTILNLLLGFYGPENGKILCNDINLQQIDLRQLRSKISYVPQDSFMLDLSVKETISLGDTSISDSMIEEVLNEVNLLEFVKSLPDGLDTIIGTDGRRLSGGQRQRLAIARALVRKPSVLILDEVTASLDAENEKQIKHIISNSHLKNSTQIWVSHRLSTIQDVDQVIVLAEGKVIQKGSFSELSSTTGLLQEFIKIQKV